jgi:DNA replication and repair protein RecF
MISSVELTNFKSHKSTKIEFDPKGTAIIGPNGSGKTNILESIYYSFLTKSFKTSHQGLINRNSDFAKVITSFSQGKDQTIEHRLKLGQGKINRTIKLNSVNKKQSEVVGIQPVVIFIPDDSRIITDGPSLRRKLINNLIVQSSKNYLEALNTYQKLLNQRNRLLYSIKNKYSSNQDQLFIYNLQMAGPIESIYQYRYELIDFLNGFLGDKYSGISGHSDSVRLEYLPTLPRNKDDILKSLEDSTRRDLTAGFTTKGPHKDDFIIRLNGHDSRDTLSRGENRTMALAIKLLEIDYIKKNNLPNPILLMDDVLSELDDFRQTKLLEQSVKNQTIITSTAMANKINGFKIVSL